MATPDSHALYVVGSDKKLKELEEVGGTGTQVTKELDTGVTVSSIVLPAGIPPIQNTISNDGLMLHGVDADRGCVHSAANDICLHQRAYTIISSRSGLAE